MRIVGWVLGTEQLLDVRAAGVHRGEEKGIFTTEALVQDRFGNPGGLRDFPRRRRMAVFTEHLACDPEDFVVGNRFGTAHATQFRAMAARMPGNLVQDLVGSRKATSR